MISNSSAVCLDLATRCHLARMDVRCGTATVEELMAIIDELEKSHRSDTDCIRETAKLLNEELTSECRMHETRIDQLEDILRSVVERVETAAKNHTDAGEIQNLHIDVKGLTRYL